MAAGAANDTLPWVEKYRPTSIGDILSHTEIIDTITRLVDTSQMPHLLLYGPAGTGKTSTVMAIARRIYGDSLQGNVLELNASDVRGIDVVRSQIKEFASTRQLFGQRSSGFKLVVLDEADQMTGEAQAALRRVIELYTRNVRFCLICNYVNKILPAIQSRCTRFRFGPLKKQLVVQRLREVAAKEEAPFTDDALAAVYKLSGGDMRKSINILQGTAMAHMSGDISAEDVYSATGAPSPEVMLQVVDRSVNKPLGEAAREVRQILAARGLALADVVRELQPWLMRLDLKPDTRCWAVAALADIEHQLCFSCNDKLQFAALMGLLQLVRVSEAEGKPIGTLFVPDPAAA